MPCFRYRITGDEQWREKGWKMFKAISRHTRAKYGYSGILDVTSSRPVQSDQMQSFWTAETLKYFYLLFSEPDVVSLDEYVLLVIPLLDISLPPPRPHFLVFLPSLSYLLRLIFIVPSNVIVFHFSNTEAHPMKRPIHAA